MLKDADITADNHIAIIMRTGPHNISQHHLFIDLR